MKNVCFLDQWKQAKMLWLQDPNQSNADNPNSIKGVLKSVKKIAYWRNLVICQRLLAA